MELVFPKEEKFSVRKFQLELLEEGLPNPHEQACAGKWFFSFNFSETIKYKLDAESDEDVKRLRMP